MERNNKILEHQKPKQIHNVKSRFSLCMKQMSANLWFAIRVWWHYYTNAIDKEENTLLCPTDFLGLSLLLHIHFAVHRNSMYSICMSVYSLKCCYFLLFRCVISCKWHQLSGALGYQAIEYFA